MKRRALLLASSALLALPFRMHAQGTASGRKRSLGVLSMSPEPKLPPDKRPFVVALRKLGWVEGENLAIERRYADEKRERLTELAEDLVRKKVEVIWVYGSESAVAAARATKTIPIVFMDVGWPDRKGLIDSFARPGRNVTGMAWADGLHLKRFELLREIAPGVRRVGWITVPASNETVAGRPYDDSHEFKAAEALGFELRRYPVEKEADLEPAFAKIRTDGVQGIAVGGASILLNARQRIADFALKYRLPSAFIATDFVVAGGLCAWAVTEADFWARFNRSVEYVDRILKGARPADLPVEQPSKFELSINLKTAHALGIRVPQSLLQRAERVIE